MVKDRRPIQLLVLLITTAVMGRGLWHLDHLKYSPYLHQAKLSQAPSLIYVVIACLIMIIPGIVVTWQKKLSARCVTGAFACLVLAGLAGMGMMRLGSFGIFIFWACYGLALILILSDLPLRVDAVQASTRNVSVIIGGLFALGFLCWAIWVQLKVYNSMSYGFADLGYWYLRLKNTVNHGDFLRLHSDLPLWWDHFCPGLAVVLPFFWLYPEPETLFVIQAICITSTAMVVFLVSRRLKLSQSISLILALLFLVYPATSQVVVGYTIGFHPNSIALPLLLLYFYAVDKGKYWQALIFGVIIFSMKEYMGVYMAGAGIPLLFRRTEWRAGLIIVMTNLGLSAFLLFVYLPSLQTGEFVHQGWFGELGSGMTLLMAPFVRPSVFWGKLFMTQNLLYLLEVFLPLVFLCWFSPRWTLSIIPALGLYLLSKTPAAVCAGNHYFICLLPGIFYACMKAISNEKEPVSWLKARGPAFLITFNNKALRYAILFAAIFVSLLSSRFLGLLPYSRVRFHPIREAYTERLEAKKALEEAIPEDAVVWADTYPVTVLLDRRYVVAGLDGKGEEIANYVVIMDGPTGRSPDELKNMIRKYATSSEWLLYLNHYPLAVFKRKNPLPTLPDTYY